MRYNPSFINTEAGVLSSQVILESLKEWDQQVFENIYSTIWNEYEINTTFVAFILLLKSTTYVKCPVHTDQLILTFWYIIGIMWQFLDFYIFQMQQTYKVNNKFEYSHAIQLF